MAKLGTQGTISQQFGLVPEVTPLTPEQVEQNRIFEQQQRDIAETKDFLSTEEQRLNERIDVINGQLRQGQPAGRVESYNNELQLLKARRAAITEIRTSLEENAVVTKSDAIAFLDAKQAERIKLREYSERVRKASAETEARKRIAIAEVQESTGVPIGIAEQIVTGKTRMPLQTTLTEIPQEFLTPVVSDKLVDGSSGINQESGAIGTIDSGGDVIGTISPIEEPKGIIGKLRRKVDLARARITTKREREGQFGVGSLGGLGVGLGLSAVSSLEFGKEFITSPIETTKSTFKGIGTEFKTIFTEGRSPILESAFQTSFREPDIASGFIIGEILQAKALTKATALGRTGVEKVQVKLGGKGATIGDDFIKVTSTSGDDLVIKKGGSVSSLSEPLETQAKLAGTETTAVSASTGFFDDLKSTLTGQKKVDKPLISPTDSPLERSFFADPRGRFRPSRLGLGGDEAKLSDLLFSSPSDVTFRRTKPQVLVFPDTKIANLPDDIGKTLGSGGTLTRSQEKRLLKFQLEPTGEFKPIGFLSKEPEITLAPGEFVKKEGTVGRVFFGGRKVDIIEAGIKKSDDFSSTKINTPKLDNLKKNLLTTTSSPSSNRIFISPTSTSISSGRLSKPFYSSKVSLPKLGSRPTSFPSISPSRSKGSLSKTIPSIKGASRITQKKIPGLSPRVGLGKSRLTSPILRRGGSSIKIRPGIKPPTKPPTTKLFSDSGTRKSLFPKRKSPLGRVRRTPSLAAIGLGIKSPKRARGEFTGIGIRPILTKRKKRKKKKK